jgi:beta-glucosidase-like glycosyl hydrolase
VLENTTNLPFCDPTLNNSARAKDLVARMTTQEKLVQLIGGIGGGVTPATTRLGVPAYQYHSEGLHGLRTTCKLGAKGETLFSTMFPQVTGMAATGNLTLIQAMSGHMATEGRAVNNYMVANNEEFPAKGGGLNYWGPTMNIGRDPRWGRMQESVSEDPWLNGAYSSHFVRGLQGEGDGVKYVKIAACCKHFYAYSLEDSDGYTRHNFNAAVSPRDLAETYLPPFAACVAAQPEQVMCSYNAVNGVPTCLDESAQNGWLRKTQGYDGLIVSDCDAVGDAWKSHKYSKNASQAAAQGIRAGCDLDCGSTYKADNLEAALSAGLMSMSDVDLALQRTFAMRFNLGMFDAASTNEYTKIGPEELNSATGQALALAAARESIVLLQNRGNLLPIQLGQQSSRSTSSTTATLSKKSTVVAVIGSIGDDTNVLMGGKSDYCPENPISLLAGLQEKANVSAGSLSVQYNAGTDTKAAVSLAKSADIVIVVRGGVQDGEANDRKTIVLDNAKDKMDATVAALKTAAIPSSKMMLVVVTGEPVALEMYVDDYDAILLAIEGGQAAGHGFADVVTGEISPSGMLPFTMYQADFVQEVKMSDMSLRPNATTGSKGKTYRFYTGTVNWPFGHGLSYASFSLKWSAGTAPATSAQALSLKENGVSVSVDVQNTGVMTAQKIIQLYISIPDKADAPRRALVAMKKVEVSPGATEHVMLQTNMIPATCAFCVYDEAGHASVPVGTKYHIDVGDGAAALFDGISITAT